MSICMSNGDELLFAKKKKNSHHRGSRPRRLEREVGRAKSVLYSALKRPMLLLPPSAVDLGWVSSIPVNSIVFPINPLLIMFKKVSDLFIPWTDPPLFWPYPVRSATKVLKVLLRIFCQYDCRAANTLS
mmetsp:Transcript_11478/g.47775  ORF Transcript_11478/g.47775 Transcript_11478/m.47775 type:complete len:129 (-) Transcript_11478:1670-2056(-)